MTVACNQWRVAGSGRMLERMTLFDLAGRRLDFLEQRHVVLARNIANADTPGFRPSDVREPDFAAMLRGRAGGGQVALAATHAGHLRSSAAPGSGRVVRPPAEVLPSGNAVSLEDEAGKLRETAGQHGRITAVYGKYLSFLKLAVGAQG